MRILHVVTMLERGGAQLNTICSAEDARRRGHTVWVAGTPGILSSEARRILGSFYIALGDRWEGDAIPGAPGDATGFIPAPMKRSIDPISDARAYAGLVRIMRTLRPDIVHTHSSKAGILGRWAARRCGVPAIVHTVHGWGFNDLQSAGIRRLFVELERAAARITERLVVVANADREKGLALGIGRDDQYVTIRSGIAPPAQDEPARRPAVRRELGIPEDAFVAIWVGNFKPQKAPMVMAEVVAGVLDRHPKMHVVIVGDGSVEDGSVRHAVETRLAARVASASTPGRAHLVGWRGDASLLIAASDLLFHTAYHEGLPRVILEARARGIPIVSTNVDGIPEAINANCDAVLVEPGDVEAIVAAVLSKAGETPRRRRESVGISSRLPEEFTLARMFDDLDNLYRSLGRT